MCDFLFQTADDTLKEIIDCLVVGKNGKKFQKSVRGFALTLHFHSPRAYEYVRNRFKNNLPHPSTLRKWYSLSASSGKPGVCEDSLEVLKNLADNMTASGQQLICSLSFDEMAIRKHIQWSEMEKKFLGRISYGSRSNQETFDVAKNAVVFMINGVNDEFNIPVAFHFIRELNATERACLLQEVMAKITALNIRVISVTFDGLPANISMCKQLGARFGKKEFHPYFFCPNKTDKVHIILDPSHMVKLARNAIGSYKVLYDDNDEKIEWKYFTELERYRNEKGYVLAHKLTKKHIQWYRAPMKVRLATETQLQTQWNF